MEDIINNVHKTLFKTQQRRTAKAKAKKKARTGDAPCSVVKLVVNPKR